MRIQLEIISVSHLQKVFCNYVLEKSIFHLSLSKKVTLCLLTICSENVGKVFMFIYTIGNFQNKSPEKGC